MTNVTSKKFSAIFFAVIILIGTAFLAYMIFVVKAGPVNTSKENSVAVRGNVTDIYEGGVKDLVFQLNNSPTIYYINRGLENGFELQSIRTELLNKNITLWYAKHRAFENGGHMTQLMYNDSIYYSEWEIPLTAQK